MKGLWKRIGSFLLTVCCALGFGLVGLKWLTEETNRFVRVCALVWLAGAVIWLGRAVREYRALSKPERKAGTEKTKNQDHVNIGGNDHV